MGACMTFDTDSRQIFPRAVNFALGERTAQNGVPL